MQATPMFRKLDQGWQSVWARGRASGAGAEGCGTFARGRPFIWLERPLKPLRATWERSAEEGQEGTCQVEGDRCGCVKPQGN
jgi:hypothetical protein